MRKRRPERARAESTMTYTEERVAAEMGRVLLALYRAGMQVRVWPDAMSGRAGARIAQKLSLDYQKNASAKTGKVSKMGVSGSYLVSEGEVTVELKFPMLIPGSMRQKVQDDIERKLDGLFP